MINNKETKYIQSCRVYRSIDFTCPKATTRESHHQALAMKTQIQFSTHMRDKINRGVKIDRASLKQGRNRQTAKTQNKEDQ